MCSLLEQDALITVKIATPHRPPNQPGNSVVSAHLIEHKGNHSFEEEQPIPFERNEEDMKSLSASQIPHEIVKQRSAFHSSSVSHIFIEECDMHSFVSDQKYTQVKVEEC